MVALTRVFVLSLKLSINHLLIMANQLSLAFCVLKLVIYNL